MSIKLNFICVAILQLLLREIVASRTFPVVTNISDCEGFKNKLQVEANIIVGENGVREFKASVDLPFEIDNSIRYTAVISKWIDYQQAWRQFLNLKGNVCDSVHKIIPKLWKKIATAAKADYDCPIKKGHYELDSFVASSEDIHLPTALRGKYSIQSNLIRNNETVLCKVVYLDITQ